MKKRIIIALAVLGSLLLHSCVSTSSIFSEYPSCELPCWRGIQIGMPYEDVFEKVRDMDDVSERSIELTDNESMQPNVKTIWFKFVSTDFKYGRLYFIDNKLDRIIFIDPLGEARHLNHWIELFGNPTKIWLDGGEHTRGVLYSSLYFTDINICIDSKPLTLEKARQIDQESEIDLVVIYDEGRIQPFMDFGCYSTERISTAVNWIGYGDY